MADSGGNQRIDLQAPPPAPIVTRPLKTGKEFTLVLPQPRFILKAWDKAIYDPGDEATLLLKGKHLGDKPYTLIVEFDDGTGWSEVDRVQANVEGGTQAKGTFKIPAVKKLTGGKFTKAEWGAAECKPGETLQMLVEAEGLEGEWVAVVVEREESPGQWEPETRWDGHVKGGKFDTSWQTPPLEIDGDPHPPGTISDLQWADEGKQLKSGDMAWMVVKAQGLDGETLRFELERQLGPGVWETVGHGCSTIKAGEARAGIEIPLPKKPDPVPTVQTARFEGKVVPGEEATLAVTTAEMDGQLLTLALDMEVDGKWAELDLTSAVVQGNKASAKVRLPPLEVVKLLEAPKEELVSATFSPIEIGTDVTLDIVTKGMDGQTLTVILETAEGGEWIPLAETTAHVKGDAASTKVSVPSPIRLLEQFVHARFEKDRYRDGEDLTLLIDSSGLDGQLAELSVEEEQADGTFQKIATDRALLKQGQVKVKLTSAVLEAKTDTGPPAPPAQGK